MEQPKIGGFGKQLEASRTYRNTFMLKKPRGEDSLPHIEGRDD
jgi:hypothetical protein